MKMLMTQQVARKTANKSRARHAAHYLANNFKKKREGELRGVMLLKVKFNRITTVNNIN